ncbi:OpgC domain-containing protein [Xanthocytophaga agilis]|uniref:OpgC domain-containing protein n=1 Tax=Xanthocytophaga agilis TaxID=3048010 RepID=A0AAE3RBK0_9BACT|nr:OpgC domain-containing protein [Xanthocytophaga agilis]MDJ1504428.1 OpgC domain-containing protein [Xanthocytophaga agilis]
MSRIVQLDGLRGLFIILITINHVNTPLTEFTYQPLGYVSAAEGFVFLSGLVAGLVYYKRLARTGLRKVVVGAIQRARTIYIYHLISLFIVCAVGYYSIIHYHYWTEVLTRFFQTPVQSLVLSLFLLYQPDFLDILPLYCLLLLSLPFLMYQFRKGNSRWVLAVSIGIWGMSQLGLGLSYKATKLLASYLPGAELSYMDIFAWQILFVAGVYLAYRRASGNELRVPSYMIWPAIAIITVLTLNRFNVLGKTEDMWWNLIDKHRLGPLRLINFGALVIVIDFLMRSYRGLFAQSWLVILGKHSLQVFSLHIVLIFLLLPMVAYYSDNNSIALLALVGFILVCLYLLAWVRERKKHVQKVAVLA